MLERISGDPKTKRKPSTAELQVTGTRSPLMRAGRSRMRSSEPITAVNESALKTYTQPTSSQTSASPATEGPITEASWKSVVLRPTALARCSRGTRLGTSEERAGPSIAEAAAVSAVSA